MPQQLDNQSHSSAKFAEWLCVSGKASMQDKQGLLVEQSPANTAFQSH